MIYHCRETDTDELSAIPSPAHDAQLPELSIKIRALYPQRLGGVAHSAVVLADHRRDVVALEPQSGITESRAADGGDLAAVEPDLRQQIFQSNRTVRRQ